MTHHIHSHSPDAMPATGTDAETLLQHMADLQAGDTDWRSGRSGLHVYWAGDDVADVALRAYGMFAQSNALAPRAFPSLGLMQDQIIAMSLPLWHAPRDAGGLMTSGGTESIILMMQALRDWATLARPGATVVLAGASAHPAYEKAAALLGLTVRRMALGPDYRIDLDVLTDAIDDQVAGLVGSAPCLPFGTIDPIDGLGQLALQHDIWLHVDACLGGYFAPFVERNGGAVPPFDFRVPGVRSLSSDLHKYGYAPKGNALLAYRDGADVRRNLFAFADWPKGRYETQTLAGTRAGGGVAATWAVMRYLGVAGYCDRATQVMQTRARLTAGLDALGRFDRLGSQHLGVLSFACSDCPDLVTVDKLALHGWYTSRIANPVGLHMTLTPVHAAGVDTFLSDLATAMAAPTSAATPVDFLTY